MRPAAGLGDAGSPERDLLRAPRRHRVAVNPQGPAAAFDRLRLFSRWRDEGLFGRINHHLVMADRERVGRAASPTTAVLDSQSIKTRGGSTWYNLNFRTDSETRWLQASLFFLTNSDEHVAETIGWSRHWCTALYDFPT